jgi:hypothetical protein
MPKVEKKRWLKNETNAPVVVTWGGGTKAVKVPRRKSIPLDQEGLPGNFLTLPEVARRIRNKQFKVYEA